MNTLIQCHQVVFRLIVLVVVVSSSSLVASGQLPPELKVGNEKLVSNGQGIRKKTFISIYESGLYLRQVTSDAKAILRADEMMAIRIRILSGFVSRSSLLDSLKDGLEKSTGGKTDAIAAETDKFVKCLQAEVRKNDTYDFVYIPQKGTFILKNGTIQGVIEGLAFKQAFFGIWLSDRPADQGLKTALLAAGKTR